MEKVEFGTEGTFPSFPNWDQRTIEKNVLQEHLVNAVECLDPRVKQTWIKKGSENLIDNTLGDRTKFNINFELERLRAIPENTKTSEQRLVQRVLSLISYDGMNPVSIAGQNPLQIYMDLNLTDPKIQPSLTASSSANELAERLQFDEAGCVSTHGETHECDFYGFNLYKNNERRIRMHVYYPNGKVNADGSPKEHTERPHCHIGKSGSIVLSGALTNEHFELEECSKKNSEFGVYKLYRNPPNEPEISKLSTRQCFGKFSPVSRHTYNAGFHYCMPASPEQEDLPEDQLKQSEKLLFHGIDVEPMTATLFTGGIALDQTHLTTFPSDSPETIWEKKGACGEPGVSLEEGHNILCQVNKKIKTELSAIRKPSTVISRTGEKVDIELMEVIADRIYNPLESTMVRK